MRITLSLSCFSFRHFKVWLQKWCCVLPQRFTLLLAPSRLLDALWDVYFRGKRLCNFFPWILISRSRLNYGKENKKIIYRVQNHTLYTAEIVISRKDMTSPALAALCTAWGHISVNLFNFFLTCLKQSTVTLETAKGKEVQY